MINYSSLHAKSEGSNDPIGFKKQLAVAEVKAGTVFPSDVQNLALRGPETGTPRRNARHSQDIGRDPRRFTNV